MQGKLKPGQQVALVVGGSRGMGRQIAIGLAQANYFVVVGGKSSGPIDEANFPPDPNSSQSTSSTVVREIELLGGAAEAVTVNVRDYASVQALFQHVGKNYGQLDVLVYNTGAIWWDSVANTPMKRFQLLQSVNIEGLYGCIVEALPIFAKQGWKARVISVSPPIYSRFFRGKTAYAIGKVGMSVLVKGLAMDWEREQKKDMAITALWPAATIESGATKQFTDKNPDELKDLRDASIFSDAVLAIISAPAQSTNGLLATDEDFLREHGGVTDFGKYSKVPGAVPRRIMPKEFPDLRVAEQADEGKRVSSTAMRAPSKL